VKVFGSAGAGADDGVVPGDAVPPAPPAEEAEGLAEAEGPAVAEALAEAKTVAAGEDDDGAAETMAPQPARDRAAAAARTETTGARNAGRMMVPFMNDAA